MTRHWFITGASGGFGAAFTQAALEAGDRVTATVRRLPALDELSNKYGTRMNVLELDVRDAGRCAAAVDLAMTAHGQIDVLVNNAGYAVIGAVEETTDEDFRDALETMFMAPIRLSRLVLPHMRARGSGTIVQVSSMGGLVSFAGVGAYCAAKGALEQASEALAGEVGPLGIRVLIVEPGAFRTGLTGQSARLTTRIDAYEPTVGPFVTQFLASDGRQPGDPHKAAQAIRTVLDMPDAPLRLVLGADAMGAIKEKLVGVARDLDRTTALGLDMEVLDAGAGQRLKRGGGRGAGGGAVGDHSLAGVADVQHLALELKRAEVGVNHALEHRRAHLDLVLLPHLGEYR
jgi:NAD(P)-dependent dehydrogenase (short-subunit alcohol dehydrogenase family)